MKKSVLFGALLALPLAAAAEGLSYNYVQLDFVVDSELDGGGVDGGEQPGQREPGHDHRYRHRQRHQRETQRPARAAGLAVVLVHSQDREVWSGLGFGGIGAHRGVSGRAPSYA